jgi:hypothetical protein
MQIAEDLSKYNPGINIRVMREDTGEVLYATHNVIANVVKSLFARLMANIRPGDPTPPYPLGGLTPGYGHDPLYGVWGLALGAGSPNWAPQTQPQETPVQTALLTEFLRKPLSRVNFVDTNFNPLSTLSTSVDFQTIVNATTDNISQNIREMGLVGGGTFGVNPPSTITNMATAPYYSGNPNDYASAAVAANTVTLINYKTLPPLQLPPGVNIIFSWVVAF